MIRKKRPDEKAKTQNKIDLRAGWKKNYRTKVSKGKGVGSKENRFIWTQGKGQPWGELRTRAESTKREPLYEVN